MDTRTIARLAEIMGQHGLNELDIEEQGLHVHLRRDGGCVPAVKPAAETVRPVLSEESAPTEESVAPASAETSSSTTVVVTSPLVGTYYCADSPESDPYVHVGSVVKAGETLCIIEAMKVMNEVKAEHDGVITKIMLENKTTVEFGSALFEMKVG